MQYDIIIIGAGPAGSGAAILLSQYGFKVLLLEKNHFPVHKICGEFFSPELSSSLQRLGVLDEVTGAGAASITKALITSSKNQSVQTELPARALGLSRYRLDPILFKRAKELGANCCEGKQVQQISGDLQTGFSVKTKQDIFEGKVVLGAYGKRDSLDRFLQRSFLKKRSPYVALKAHYKGQKIPATVELHSFPGGYCGISPIEEGLINVCLITHKRIIKQTSDDIDRVMNLILKQNSFLAGRFSNMERVSNKLLAISQISFTSKTIFAGDVCMIGDAAGIIAPLSGDGVAIAVRSAEIVTPLVASFLKNEISASQFKRAYHSARKSEFYRRLLLGRILQSFFIRPTLASSGVWILQISPPMLRWMVNNTRGFPVN